MHIERLRYLLEARGAEVHIFDHYKRRKDVLGAPGHGGVKHLNRNPLRYWWAARQRTGIVHYHYSSWPTLLAVRLSGAGRHRSLVLTVHGQSLSTWADHSDIRRRIVVWALHRFDRVIYVSTGVRSRLRTIGAPDGPVIPAFLPAPLSDRQAIDSELDEFLSQPGTTLLASAFRASEAGNREDIYGLDLLTRAFTMLAATRHDLRLGLFVSMSPTHEQRRYIARLEEEIAAAGLTDHVIWRFGCPLVPALRKSVIYVRPTRSDGDAVSVREAISLNVPVVASDVTERPAPCAVFKTGDTEDLLRVLGSVISGQGPRPEVHLPNGETAPLAIVNEYMRLMRQTL